MHWTLTHTNLRINVPPMRVGERPGHQILPLMTRWTPGPDLETDGGVVVSVTDFTANRVRDVPGIVRTGLRLRAGWYAMRGAVGLCLWSLPLDRRSGSISVWTSEDDLRGFIGLPAHLEVMRRYGNRGSVRSTTWKEERFASADVLDQARRWIAGSPG
jgi:hypothetical protein